MGIKDFRQNLFQFKRLDILIKNPRSFRFLPITCYLTNEIKLKYMTLLL